MHGDNDDIFEAMEESNSIRVMRSEENRLVGIIRSVIFLARMGVLTGDGLDGSQD